jgi:hypothetical protein
MAHSRATQSLNVEYTNMLLSPGANLPHVEGGRRKGIEEKDRCLSDVTVISNKYV